MPLRQEHKEDLERNMPLNKEGSLDINALTKKLINLRKQQQGVEKSIACCKKNLIQYFDEMETDRVSIELGTLVRVEKEGETDFIIEI